ncbi:DUF4230 domain-containing protein [Psychrobacter okhotskensis]|uniref:DUF4230 domain-containing protein n=1 Tax=Psychrobacter okhotskensis TaxID=212403 RepID=UPI00156303EC|nr:DUF4230 domain-containing protein [Psychrobacter okhotskensis]NRD71050.1 DUF4230 domain-containing protein [Psychrobacter okhotskensis]
MINPDKRSSASNNTTAQPVKKPIALMSWLVLLIGLAAIVFAIYTVQNLNKEAPIETITREGVVTQIQQLNRLQTVAFSVDTVITSERPGSWMKLWQDEQKGLFIARGRVEAGIDLSDLTPEMVQVVQPDIEIDEAKQADVNTPVSMMPQINITLPPSEIFSVYLDDIEIYDWQTGAFGMMQVDPKIWEQAQSMAKKEVLERACRGDVMNMALKNAQTQLQQLFALTGAVVTVTTQGAGACQLPTSTS